MTNEQGGADRSSGVPSRRGLVGTLLCMASSGLPRGTATPVPSAGHYATTRAGGGSGSERASRGFSRRPARATLPARQSTKGAEAMGDYAVGMVGLGVMGRNLSLNMEEHGFSVAAFDAWPEQVERFEKDSAG